MSFWSYMRMAGLILLGRDVTTIGTAPTPAQHHALAVHQITHELLTQGKLRGWDNANNVYRDVAVDSIGRLIPQIEPYVRLGASNSVGTGPGTTLYTCPGSKRCVITDIFVVNNNGGAITLSIQVNGIEVIATAAAWGIAGWGQVFWNGRLVLNAAETIVVTASGANVGVIATGVEYSN